LLVYYVLYTNCKFVKWCLGYEFSIGLNIIRVFRCVFAASKRLLNPDFAVGFIGRPFLGSAFVVS